VDGNGIFYGGLNEIFYVIIFFDIIQHGNIFLRGKKLPDLSGGFRFPESISVRVKKFITEKVTIIKR
jgi:hypothetical protein